MSKCDWESEELPYKVQSYIKDLEKQLEVRKKRHKDLMQSYVMLAQDHIKLQEAMEYES